MFKFFLIITLLIVNSLAGDDQVNKLWKDANRFYTQGEEQIRKSNHGESAVLFKASLDMLKKIQYNFPTWNPPVVKNRIKACEQRIIDAEKLILQSIQNLTKEELLEKLKETQIAKAKFSKAMMILYDDLNRAKTELKIKNKSLSEAREAAGLRVADKAHLDKLTFENLKLRKTVRDKEAQILAMTNEEASPENNAKLDTEILKYKKMQKEISGREEKLKTEKADLARQLKELSFKYTDLIEKEKAFSKNEDNLEIQLGNWRDLANKEKNLRVRYQNSSKALDEKLTLALSRVKDAKEREAEMVNSIAALKKNGGSSKMVANLTERNDQLIKENNRLKKVEIDLSAKLRTVNNNYEKAVQMSNDHVKDSAIANKEYNRLKSKTDVLEEEFSKVNKSLKEQMALSKSLSNEVMSLKSQIKILQKVRDDYKKRAEQMSTTETAGQQVDSKLLAAYEKKNQESTARINFLNKKLRELEKQNQTLKEENVAGDEQIIQKYVEVRDELKETKIRAKKLFEKLKTFEGGVDSVIKAAMLEDEKAENDLVKKINELLYQAGSQQENQTAIGLYTEVLKLEKDNFDALLRIGLLMYEDGHFHDAVIHLQKAFYLKPDHPQLLLALGVSLIELEKLDLAVSALSRLVGKYPKDAQAHFQLGVVMQGLGWTEPAIKQLEVAFELDPQSGDTAFNLAVSYLGLPEPNIEKAEVYYKKALLLGVVNDPVLEKYFSD